MQTKPNSQSHRRRGHVLPRRLGCARRTRRIRRTRRGLTLVECLVASVLLAFSAAAAATALSAAYQNQQHARDAATATDAATEIADQLALLPYDSAAPIGFEYATDNASLGIVGNAVRDSTLVRVAGERTVANELDGLQDTFVDAQGRSFLRSIEVVASDDFPGAAEAVVTVKSPAGQTVAVRRLLLPGKG